MDAIQDTLSQLQSLFTQRMDAYQGELRAVASTPSVTSLTEDFNAFRSFTMATLQVLQNQVDVLAHQIDDLETRNRRKILLLHGIPEVKNEVTTEAVVKVLVQKLKLDQLTSDDISRAHRMGRTSLPERPRPILFELNRMDHRDKIWQAKTALKATGITLSEFLTKNRHVVFASARQRLGVNKCWTRGGIVYVLGAKGERHRVNSLSELEKIVPEAPKSTAAAVKEPVVSSKTRRAAALNKK